jgi:hypothetical protein
MLVPPPVVVWAIAVAEDTASTMALTSADFCSSTLVRFPMILSCRFR